MNGPAMKAGDTVSVVMNGPAMKADDSGSAVMKGPAMQAGGGMMMKKMPDGMKN